MDRLCNHDVLQTLTGGAAEERENCFICALQANGKIHASQSTS